jgi:hypothetical protein
LRIDKNLVSIKGPRFLLHRFFETILIRRVFSLLVLLEIGLACVIYMNVFFIDRATGLPILDMEFGYSTARVTEILGGYGPVEWARYEIIMMADLIHPAVYGSLFGSIIWRMIVRVERKWLAIVPLFAALFDWGENAAIWVMFSEPLAVDYSIAQIGSALSYCKHGLLALSVVILTCLLIRGLWRVIVR